MTKRPVKPKRENRADATLRNVQSVNKRLLGLEKRIEQLEAIVKAMIA